jgi:hypothetical protein
MAVTSNHFAGVENAEFLRRHASAKRGLAAEILKLLAFLSLREDRAMFIRHAAELEAEAAVLTAQADGSAV